MIRSILLENPRRIALNQSDHGTFTAKEKTLIIIHAAKSQGNRGNNHAVLLACGKLIASITPSLTLYATLLISIFSYCKNKSTMPLV